jgi:SNF2 family DNA or RNA helicase
VQACASGLTLTAANHCLLLDLQSHEGRELQLVNRVWRIGQTKPVSVKRLVAAGTVEERMLHLRKRSKGLMASESDADQIAVSRVEEPAASGGGGGAPEQSERTEELRFLFNAVRAEA